MCSGTPGIQSPLATQIEVPFNHQRCLHQQVSGVDVREVAPRFKGWSFLGELGPGSNLAVVDA